VVDGDHVFLAGQLAADRPEPPPLGDIEVETRTCMELIQAVLAELGLGFADVVRMGVFMTDLGEFERMDRVYASFLTSGHAPARTTVGVAQLLFGCRIEIDCVARLRAPA
jgi:2-iminobutanoate/2-iminopropanoate deaminase